MITLEPFWKMMQERGITTYQLENHYALNPAEISRLRNNHNFTLRSLDKYCLLFQCKVEDIILYVDEDSKL